MDIIWSKTGMLSSVRIIQSVAQSIKQHSLSTVVDPVMAAEAGGNLLEKSALKTLKEELLPVSFVVTPNIGEAEALSGLTISTIEDGKKAARTISQIGVKNVIITGGHLDATDILYESKIDHFTLIPGRFLKGGTHGSGCTYSSALTAFLARGYTLVDAAKATKQFVEKAIISSRSIGKGVGPVNQMGYLSDFLVKEDVLRDTRHAVDLLRHCQPFAKLIAEVGCNIAMALPNAVSETDVTGVEGRMVKLNSEPYMVGCVSFGASSHIARIVLATMQFNPSRRAAMNIRYSEKILDICRKMQLSISSFDRAEEPENTKTMDWGVTHAIKTFGSVPDVIYDKGGAGKEPMIRIIGETATDVASIVIDIATDQNL
jgi:hydroxymethylpyrimidine/phosphomethylpyrimidine kinase